MNAESNDLKRTPAGSKRRKTSAYEIVGYGKPPKHSQFKKGEARKRKPRRDDDDNLMTIFKRYMTEKVRLREGENYRIMTRGEAVLYVNYHRSLSKDPRAMSNILMVAEQTGMFTDKANVKEVGAPLLVPESAKSAEEWLKTMALYDIMLREGHELTALEDKLEPGQHKDDLLGIRWLPV